MAKERGRKEGIFGPYEQNRKWRVIHVDRDGKRSSSDFADENSANAFARKARRALTRQQSLSIQQALDRYELHMREAGLKTRSIETVIDRVSGLLAPMVDDHMPDLTPMKAEKLYDTYRDGRAADTHQGALQYTKRFFGWAVGRKIVISNPFAEIKPVGRKKRGKPQLRIDEARKFLAACLAAGDARATVAIMALVMGMRSSEITGLVVRDVDDNGRVLWVASGGGKTAAATRKLAVPELLQPLLRKQCEGKAPTAYLFTYHRNYPRIAVKKMCEVAGVPVVTAHGLRGTHASLSAASGVTASAIVLALGHENFRVTQDHYLAPGALENGKTQGAIDTLLAGNN